MTYLTTVNGCTRLDHVKTVLENKYKYKQQKIKKTNTDKITQTIWIDWLMEERGNTCILYNINLRDAETKDLR